MFADASNAVVVGSEQTLSPMRSSTSGTLAYRQVLLDIYKLFLADFMTFCEELHVDRRFPSCSLRTHV